MCSCLPRSPLGGAALITPGLARLLSSSAPFSVICCTGGCCELAFPASLQLTQARHLRWTHLLVSGLGFRVEHEAAS